MHIGYWWESQKVGDHWEDEGKGKNGKVVPVLN
jgi:hypothetical protein